MIEEMFWLYVSGKSHFARYGALPATTISGTENHEMMHYSNALLALQAIKNRPAYKDRKLPDGRSAAEHYAAANAHYNAYCVAHAKHGLLVEAFSGYGKYTLPELFNLRDFAEDPDLRANMEKYLHLIWADWAIGQLNGVRGGGRLRIYQGHPEDRAKPDAFKTEFTWGARDYWQQMSKPFFRGEALEMKGKGHPIAGWPLVLASTGYRVPDVIMDLARDREGRGEYTYIARRLARRMPMAIQDVPLKTTNWHPFDGDDTRMIGYDYCTPDYVMGSLMIDPTLPHANSQDARNGVDLAEGYPGVTLQNRYHAIVFASDVNARVVPQCEGLKNGKTYGQQQAVQHKNVLLVQRHAQAKQTGDMRILYGGKGMKERLIERDGWLILQEGKAWLGVKGFSRTEPNQACGHAWDNEVFLRMKDGSAPVALITGRAKDFPDIDAFAAYLATFSGTLQDGWFTLTGGKDATLSLHLACKALPKVNGADIDLRPKMLFDSPFMRSEHGSGVVTIRKDSRELTINLTGNK